MSRKTKWDRLGSTGGRKRSDRIQSTMDDIAVAIAVRSTNNTTISRDGHIRGEVADAIIEARRWARV